MKKVVEKLICAVLILSFFIAHSSVVISYAVDSVQNAKEITLQNDFKSKMYENYTSEAENDFYYTVSQKYELSTSSESIVIENATDAFVLNGKIREIGEDLQYKYTFFSVKSFNQILGDNGEIRAYDENGQFLGGIKSDISKNDDDYYILKYNDEVSKVKFEVSKPVQNGELVVIDQKCIKSSLVNNIELNQFESIKEIVSNSKVSDGNDEKIYETRVELKEPSLDIDLELSEKTLYTLKENKLDFTVVLKNSSYENKLFRNPVIEIELPEEIENITIDKIMTLYRNGLSLYSWDVLENNNKKYLRIELDGTQKEYLNSKIIDGTNIVIQTTIKPLDETPIKTSSMKLKVSNDNNEIVEKEVDIDFMSKYGLFTISKVFSDDESEIGIGEAVKNIEIDVDSDEKEISYEMKVINNYTESLKNVEIIGVFPGEENKRLEENNLKNTFNSKLKTTVGIEGADAKVYYSDEINPESTSSTWTMDYTKLNKISSYKIEVGTLEKAQTLTFNYDTEIPADLTYNQSVYSSYDVNYMFNDQNFKNTSIIGAKTESKDVTIEECQIQENDGYFDIGIQASKGGKVLTESDSVHKDQIIEYSVVVTNNNNFNLENIEVETELNNANIYEIRLLNSDEYTNAWEDDYYIYDEIKDKKSSVEKFDLKSGESKVLRVQGVIRGEVNDVVFANVNVKCDRVEQKVKSISNKIIDAKMNILIDINGTENYKLVSDSILKLNVDIKNNSIDDFNNTEFELILPKDCTYEKYSESLSYFDFKVSECREVGDKKIYKFYVENVEKNDDLKIMMIIKLAKLDLDVDSVERSFAVKGIYNDEEYYSNCYKKEIEQIYSDIDVNLTSNVEEGKRLNHDDEVEFYLDLKNIGSKDIDLTTFIPQAKGLVFENYSVYVDNILQGSADVDGGELSVLSHLNPKTTQKIVFVGKVNEDDYEYSQEFIRVMAKFESSDFLGNKESNEVVFNINNEHEEEILGQDPIILDLPDLELDTSNIGDVVLGNSNIQIDSSEDNENSEEKDKENNNLENSKNENIKNENSKNELENSGSSNVGNQQSDNKKENNKNEINSNTVHVNEVETSVVESFELSEKEQNNTKQEEKKGTGSISGVVWNDDNNDGIYDNSEKTISNVTVYLVEDGKQNTGLSDYKQKSKTNNAGVYEFKELSAGNYIVIFDYDFNEYQVSTYQGETENKSSAISKEVNGRKYGVSNQIKVENNAERKVNLGLAKNKVFDFSIQKQVSTVEIKNGKDDRVKKYNNEKIVKEEISAKAVNDTKAKVTYRFVVKNNGEIPGTVNEITDILPSGLEFSKDLNKDWIYENGKLTYTKLENLVFEPGEFKEIYLTVEKNINENNLGTFVNKAKIVKSTNSKNVEDSNSSNDEDEVTVIFTIKTGGKYIVIGSIIIIIILGAIIFVIKKSRIKIR